MSLDPSLGLGVDANAVSQRPQALDYAVSLDGSPLSSWRSGVKPVPQCLLVPMGKVCTINCWDYTTKEGRGNGRQQEICATPMHGGR